MEQAVLKAALNLPQALRGWGLMPMWGQETRNCKIGEDLAHVRVSEPKQILRKQNGAQTDKDMGNARESKRQRKWKEGVEQIFNKTSRRKGQREWGGDNTQRVAAGNVLEFMKDTNSHSETA